MAASGGAGSNSALNAEGLKVNLAFVAAIVAVATIGGFMFGYDSGVINGAQQGLEKTFGLSKLGVGVNVGAILVGCAAGAFAAGSLADVLGRRTVMIAAAIAFLLSALGTGAAANSLLFILCRFVGGLGVGAASVLSPVYISEVTPAGIRGRLSSAQQIMIVIGLTGAFLANYVLAHTAGSSTRPLWLGIAAWRWMFWLQAIPASIFLTSLLFIPESPRFLVARDRTAEAEAILSRLFGAGQGAGLAERIRASFAADHKPSLRDLFDKGRVRPIVWAGIGLAVFQQFVGINIVFYYGAVLWQSVGFSEDDSLKINILSGVLSIASCLAAIALIDRIGRKPLLLIGSAGMTVALGTMAFCFSTAATAGGTPHMSPSIGLVALIAANAYAALFNFSWGPVMWVMLGEMFPNQIRGSGLAVSGLAQWLANALISVSFPTMAAGLGLPFTYGVYAACALISFFFVRALVHETRGRTLEEMTG